MYFYSTIFEFTYVLVFTIYLLINMNLKNITSKTKKIIIFLFLSFIFVNSVNAVDTVFYQPDVSILPWTATLWTATWSNRISDDSISRLQFCIEFWWTYTTHTSGTDWSWRAIYQSWQWDYNWNSTVLDTVTCDISTWWDWPYADWWTIWTWSTIWFMYQDNYWVYHVDENFLIEFIIRIILVFIALPFFFYSTRKVWRMWRKTITWRNT